MIADLSSDALVRVFASEPAMSPTMAHEIAAAIGKLLVQFNREGRCATTAAAVEGHCRFLVIAWEGPPLSGCSHDKIAQVIATHEARSGCALLTAPPIAIGEGTAVCLTDRAGLRRLLATAACDGDTPVWNLRAAHLGAWRMGPVPLRSSPWASLARESVAHAGDLS